MEPTDGVTQHEMERQRNELVAQHEGRLLGLTKRVDDLEGHAERADNRHRALFDRVRELEHAMVGARRVLEARDRDSQALAEMRDRERERERERSREQLQHVLEGLEEHMPYLTGEDSSVHGVTLALELLDRHVVGAPKLQHREALVYYRDALRDLRRSLEVA